jgi:hypothetical protein
MITKHLFGLAKCYECSGVCYLLGEEISYSLMLTMGILTYLFFLFIAYKLYNYFIIVGREA